MREEIDWSVTTWEGSRRQQHRTFLALSFREKLEIIEELGEVAGLFARRRFAQGMPVQLARFGGRLPLGIGQLEEADPQPGNAPPYPPRKQPSTGDELRERRR